MLFELYNCLQSLFEMESMVNRWQNAIQAAQEIQNSRLIMSRKKQEPSKLYKEQLIVTQIKDSKVGILSEDKNKDTKAKSIDNKNSRQNRLTSNKKTETPSKKNDKKLKKEEKAIQNTVNSILELFQPANPDKYRAKLRSLIENFSLSTGRQKIQDERNNLVQSTFIMRPTQRAYVQLEQRYLQCQKQRQYLKGKLQMYNKRTQGLQRQVQRYGKIQKLIDQSISREAQLKQQLSRTRHEKDLLEQTTIHQRQIYEKEVESIRQLIDSLKRSLPIQ